MANDDGKRLVVLPEELEQREPGVYISDPQYKVNEFVGEVLARRGEAWLALRDEFQALITGLCDQFAMRRKHDPSFDLKKITFMRPRWMNDGGTFMFDINHAGDRLLPGNHRWD
jgi:hypothetical protein